MAHGRTWLSVVVASLLVSGSSVRANGPCAGASQELPPQQRLPLSNSQSLLAMDPSAFVQFLNTARPEPVSPEYKARVLSSLPEEGEVTNLNAAARRSLQLLSTCFGPTTAIQCTKSK